MRAVPFVSATVCAALLAGCALGPRPQAPVVTTPQAWNAPADAARWPTADWWRGFGSVELDRLIVTAQANNDDLAAATARVREADAQARIAGAALLPTLNAEPVANYQRRLNPIGNVREYGTLNGVFNASYEIDVWGKNHDAHLSAIRLAQATADALEVTRLTIVTSVAATYFNLLATQDRIAVARAQTKLAQQILNGLLVQQQAGIATGLQVAQQRTVAQTLAAALPPLETQRVHLVDALAILVGRVPEGFTVTGGSLNGLRLPSITAGLPSELLLHRPDVQAAERDLAAADANVSVARKTFLPSFSLTGGGGVGSIALARSFAGPIGLFDIGLNILGPIFDGGRRRGQLQYNNAYYQEIAANYQKSIHQAFGDVEDALSTEQNARQAVSLQANATASATQALSMARIGYGAGVSDILTLVSAQQALITTQAQQTQAQLDRAQGLVALYKALGGGWRLPS